MLSIGKLGAGQQSYYEQQVARGRDDYYSGRGEAPGEWVGAGADLLGLVGQVEAAQFNAVMAGDDPRDGREGPLRASPQIPKVVGFDLTFSAPKSVSVLFAAADERTSGALIAAHETAVRAALGYLEEEAVRVRRGAGGVSVEPGQGLVAAAYRHRMSRALDPQLHTHVVAANAAQGPDGRWTALDGRHLYRHAKTAGCLYQAQLRHEIGQRLGLEWGPVVNGAAELRGIDRSVLEHFSQRRRDILARQAELEAAGAAVGDAGREAIAHDTRERKSYEVETHTWREGIRARAAEMGLDAEAIEGVLSARSVTERTERAEGVEALGDRLTSAHGLTANANTFDSRDVLQALAGHATQGAPVAVLRADGEAFEARGDVLATQGGGATTAELVAREAALIAAAVGRADGQVAVVDGGTLARAIAGADRPLTGEQAAAVTGIVGSGNGVDVLEAHAGTGKTFTAGVLRQVYEDAGYRVIGTAPTGRAVRELTDEAGIPAWTIDRLLLDLDRYDSALLTGTVVVVDEAGMAATRPTARLLEHAERAGVKVVAVGDSGQLPSVQAGGWMRAVGEQIGAHELRTVQRQRHVGERRALASLHNGRPEDFIAWAEREERVAVHPEPGQAVGDAISEWRAASAEHGPAGAVLIARANTTRQALNDAARAHRRAIGALGEDVSYGPVTVAVGDRIICRHNDRGLDVDNGTRGTVRHADERKVVIETDAGTIRSLAATYTAEHVEHAYALTGHGMQGGTVERAFVVAGPRELSQGWSYTALSRARGATRLHIDVAAERDAIGREEIAPGELHTADSRATVIARVAARMAVRDDEDLAVHQLVPEPVAGDAADVRTRPETPPATVDPAARSELRALSAERAALRAQLERLPLRNLQRVQTAEQAVVTAGEQRQDLADRLVALPDPARGVFARRRDDHAADRARLTTAVSMATDQLERAHAALAAVVDELGDVGAIRVERDGLLHGLQTVELEHRAVRDALVERDVQQPPTWATELLGPRPEAPGRWETALRAVSAYRHEHDVSDGTGLGARPDDREQRRAYDRALERAAAVQPGLRHGVDRGVGLD